MENSGEHNTAAKMNKKGKQRMGQICIWCAFSAPRKTPTDTDLGWAKSK